MSFFDFDDSYSANKESSFFVEDISDNRAGEKRTVNCFDADGDGEENSSELQKKASKMSKVEQTSSPVKRVNSPKAQSTVAVTNMNMGKPDMNDNTKRVKAVVGGMESNSLLSDTLKDSIEEMRSKVLAMIPDIKRQEEASESIIGRVTVLQSDISNYREQLADVKHEYTSRLNQISSILNMGR